MNDILNFLYEVLVFSGDRFGLIGFLMLIIVSMSCSVVFILYRSLKFYTEEIRLLSQQINDLTNIISEVFGYVRAMNPKRESKCGK